MKYFLQFVFYTMLSAATLVIYLALTFINILLDEDAEAIMTNPWYIYCFGGSIVAFIIGFFFAYFTAELLREARDAIRDN